MMGVIRNLPNSTTFWLALVAIVLFGSIFSLVCGGWDWLRETEPNLMSESKSTTIRNAGFVIAGVLALVFAVWRSVVAQRQAAASQSQAETAERQAEIALRQTETAQRQADTAQQGLLNERYQRGAEMLGNDVLAVRLGGIYALQRLAEEHPEQYHVQIMRLFCAFVRNPAGKAEGSILRNRDGRLFPELREDVQEVMRAVGTRSDADIGLEKAAPNFRLYLRNANLQHGRLQYLNLSRSYFVAADFSEARLNGANLSNADFRYANLSRAILDGVNLTDANLTGASFNGRGRAGGNQGPATGLTQEQLDVARSDPNHSPDLVGVRDARTSKQLVWQGEPLEEEA